MMCVREDNSELFHSCRNLQTYSSDPKSTKQKNSKLYYSLYRNDKKKGEWRVTKEIKNSKVSKEENKYEIQEK